MIPANILAEAGKVILPKLIGAGLSYAQAAQQNTLFKDAQKAADIAVQEAKGFAAINEMEALRIPMEAYENSQREITSQQQQAVDALQQTRKLQEINWPRLKRKIREVLLCLVEQKP